MSKQSNVDITSLIENTLRFAVYWMLQPTLIAISLYLADTKASIDAHSLFIVVAFCLLTLFENIIPARKDWRKSFRENVALFGFVFVAGAAYAAVEAFFLILPRAIVGFLLGGESVGAAFVSLTAVTALLAHSNLRLNSAIVGWFFTTNRFHIHHHSQVINESNTNYGYVCIIWDRLFGTFHDADTKDTGIGNVQPSYKNIFTLPFKQ